MEAKKDENLPFCVEKRKINTVNVKYLYPIPKTNECIWLLGAALILSTIETFNGYWQFDITNEDRHKTYLVYDYGTFRYLRKSFGLENALTTFKHALDLICTRYKWKTCLLYMDHIIFVSRDI